MRGKRRDRWQPHEGNKAVWQWHAAVAQRCASACTLREKVCYGRMRVVVVRCVCVVYNLRRKRVGVQQPPIA